MRGSSEVERRSHTPGVAGSSPAPATIGPVAQLGEHLPCKQGVRGSIPRGSTNVGPLAQLVAHRSRKADVPGSTPGRPSRYADAAVRPSGAARGRGRGVVGSRGVLGDGLNGKMAGCYPVDAGSNPAPPAGRVAESGRRQPSRKRQAQRCVRGFESHPCLHLRGVAQPVERSTDNREAAGSTPAPATTRGGSSSRGRARRQHPAARPGRGGGGEGRFDSGCQPTRGRSSAVEQPALNRQRVGSSPTGPTTPGA